MMPTRVLFARYTFVGFLVFVLHVSVFNLLVVVMDSNAYIAQSVATMFSISTAFAAHRLWTFSAGIYSLGWGASALRFLGVQLIGASLPFLFIWLFRNVLELKSLLWDNVAGNIVGLGLAFVVRFLLSKTWVFRNEESD